MPYSSGDICHSTLTHDPWRYHTRIASEHRNTGAVLEPLQEPALERRTTLGGTRARRINFISHAITDIDLFASQRHCALCQRPQAALSPAACHQATLGSYNTVTVTLKWSEMARLPHDVDLYDCITL